MGSGPPRTAPGCPRGPDVRLLGPSRPAWSSEFVGGVERWAEVAVPETTLIVMPLKLPLPVLPKDSLAVRGSPAPAVPPAIDQAGVPFSSVLRLAFRGAGVDVVYDPTVMLGVARHLTDPLPESELFKPESTGGHRWTA